MANPRRTLEKILSGSKNIRFYEFVALLGAFGFELKRSRGSHFIYKHPGVPELLSVQPSRDGQAKPYQIKQFLRMVEEHSLKLGEGENAE